MQKHSDEYKAAWDGKGPDGGVLATWDDYITAVSAESAYVSDLELKATARLYDVKVVLVPEMAHFPPVVFHSGQKSPKRCLIMWYSGCHLDLLLVAGGKKLPTDIAEVTAAINFELRVGGESSAASSAGSWGPRTVLTASAQDRASSTSWRSPAGTVWTGRSGAKGTRPTQATIGSGEGCDLPDAEAPEDPSVKPKRKAKFYWWGHGVKKRSTFRCELCDYAVAVSSTKKYGPRRYYHCKRYHGGEGLPGRKFRASEYVNPIKGARSKYSWICPLCPQGMLGSIRSALSQTAVFSAKRRHKDLHHPKVPLAKWKSLCEPRAGGHIAVLRVTICNREIAKHFRDDTQHRVEGFEKFVWPRPCAFEKKRIARVKFRTAWTCLKCGCCFVDRTRIPQHTSKLCKPARAAKCRKQRLKALARTELWCRNHPAKHGIQEPVLLSIFTIARAIIGGERVQS